jgi:hypothetical protein
MATPKAQKLNQFINNGKRNSIKFYDDLKGGEYLQKATLNLIEVLIKQEKNKRIKSKLNI